MPAKPRETVSLPLDARLVREARALGIDLAAAAEDGIRQAATRRWGEENAESLRQSNAHVEQHGLPLVKHRLF